MATVMWAEKEDKRHGATDGNYAWNVRLCRPNFKGRDSGLSLSNRSAPATGWRPQFSRRLFAPLTSHTVEMLGTIVKRIRSAFSIVPPVTECVPSLYLPLNQYDVSAQSTLLDLRERSGKGLVSACVLQYLFPPFLCSNFIFRPPNGEPRIVGLTIRRIIVRWPSWEV